MATLYVQEQGTHLTRRHEQLIVRRGKDIVVEIPIIKVDRVQVMGQGIQVSTAATTLLARKGIPLVYTNRSGTVVYAISSGGPASNGDVRLAQARLLLTEPQRATRMVQAIVLGKLRNQQLVLEQAGDWAGAGPAARRTVQQVIGQVPQARDIDQARGYEGAGAAAYWAAWRAVVGQRWGFAGRAYNPPPDPVNALLSFGYTLLLNDLLAAVHASGLDPYLGFFHTVQSGRPSLALDLEEEFRPWVIDVLVLDVLASGTLRPQDFVQPADRPGAIYAGDQAREQLLAAYERRLAGRVVYPFTTTHETVRRCLVLQVQQCVRAIEGTQDYHPLIWPPAA